MTEEECIMEHLNVLGECLGRFMIVVGKHTPELQDDITHLVNEWQRIQNEIEAEYEAGKSKIQLLN